MGKDAVIGEEVVHVQEWTEHTALWILWILVLGVFVPDVLVPAMAA